MSRLIVTRRQDQILTALFEGRLPLTLSLEPEQTGSLLNHIYIGRVQKVVPNIQAVFIEFAPGKTGYYSLAENPVQALNRPDARSFSPGDLVLVQVCREAVKTKAPVLTANLSFPGRFCVLTSQKPGISFSARIRSQERKDQLKPRIQDFLSQRGQSQCGVIVRTNGGQAQDQEILDELSGLLDQYEAIVAQAPYRTCYSCLYRSMPEYMTQIRDAGGQLEAIVTDQPDLYQAVGEYLSASRPEEAGRLELYQDSMVSLSNVYGLERAVKEALEKRVWLKSGGYLVIEPTEAMVVIDVNTGKFSEKKTQRETVLKINLEAAREIGRQLRLRNLSGIIMIDFIDMAFQEDKDQLMEFMSQVSAQDPIKTTVVEMTRLNLVELTRKKVKRPFYEQIRQSRTKENEGEPT